ncbi:MAG: hypothetical protein RIM99_00820 [Cyclobacteriaceae bacterium]
MRKLYSSLILFIVATSSLLGQSDSDSLLNNLPPYIRQITHFGERADWSLDGKRILFLEKTFGDVFEVDVETGIIRPMTHHFFHEGFVRALYLANGDILLSGSPTFNSNDPWKSRDARNTELWVLKSDLSGPPVKLGVHCKEGPAVSRKKLRIGWSLGSSIYVGDIEYEKGNPKLKSWRPLFQSSEMPAPVKGWDIETQNFRPNDEDELIFYAFGGNFGFQAEVMSYNMKDKTFRNYSVSPKSYDEAEGPFPDGLSILIESNRHRTNYKGMKEFLTLDIYQLQLDGSGDVERITYFNDNPNYKASNPVVSDDGRYIAFQHAHASDAAGVGRGILILDMDEWEKQNRKKKKR